MTSSKAFKTAAALLLVVSGLSMAPSALADATTPPSGKYYDTVNNKAVYYSAATHTTWDIEETVDPYDCVEPDFFTYYFADDDPVQCGNCAYVPDANGGEWKLASTSYTFGRCISLDPNDDYVLEDTKGLVALRVDVRLLNNVEKYRWSTQIWAFGGDMDDPPSGECYPDPSDCSTAVHECARDTTLLVGTVHYCGEVPEKIDVRDRPWFSQLGESDGGWWNPVVRLEYKNYNDNNWYTDSWTVVGELVEWYGE